MLILVVAGLLLWTPHYALATEASARIDTDSVASDQSFRLVLEVKGETAASPDLSVLANDFEIIDRRSQRSRSVINGRRSERYSLTFTLLPRRAGELQIPPIPVGDALTEPLRLWVTEAPASGGTQAITRGPASVGMQAIPQAIPERPASDGPQAITEVLVEASVEPADVRVQQQIVLTAKVFMNAPVSRPRLHDPQLSHAEILPLGEDRYESRRGDQTYSVYERRYALFPQQSGQLEIEPLLFEGWVRDTAADAYPPPERPVRVRSQPLSVKVSPPAGGKGSGGWLPARGVTLTESGPETYRVGSGEPIERRISLRVDGVQAAQLPKLAVEAPYQLAKGRRPPRLWDERKPEGVIGTRQELVTLTAQEPGHYRLPPLSFDWWNTKTKRWEQAMLPARDLVVSAAGIAARALAPPAAAAATGLWAAPNDAAASEETSFPKATDTQPRRTESSEPNRWIWIAFALVLIWLATMVGWWRSKRRRIPAAAPAQAEILSEPEQEDPLEQAIAAIRAAYESGNAATAREALLAWAHLVLPENIPSNLARLAQRCPEPLRGQVLMLEEAFFSPHPVPWDRQPVWEHMHHFEPAPPEEPASFRRAKPLRRRASAQST
ncbi:MAG: BatD family protein [Pseudomonadota bacterium]|nr:BatD family protein [Pseudomonadota bacterium]